MHPYECIDYELCIMHYAIHILKYARVNSFILLVDFSHRKLHPTMHNVHLFYYACIYGDKCTQMHISMHDAWPSSTCMMHVEDGNFEPCLKDIGAWGQEWWPKVISFGEVHEPSHFTVLHAVLLLVLIESVHLHHEDNLVEFWK